MSETLNSKLRILVAKTFRAEKLYSSIRNSAASKGATLSGVSEIANDIRAKEWHTSHFQLRSMLNEILGLGSNKAIVEKLTELHAYFRKHAQVNTREVERGVKRLKDISSRHEFAHVLKLSSELIRFKARAQANKVIADELASVLNESIKEFNSEIKLGSLEEKMARLKSARLSPEEVVHPKNVKHPANVIPLRKKVVNGSDFNKR